MGVWVAFQKESLMLPAINLNNKLIVCRRKKKSKERERAENGEPDCF
jgi:hypothetical protein